MNASLESDGRLATILQTAAIAAGPMNTYSSTKDWEASFTTACQAISAFAFAPGSKLAAMVSDSETTRQIDVTIVSASPEQKSNRGLIEFRSDRPSKFAKNGVETVRTDRLEDPAALKLAQEIFPYAGTGQKVRLTIVNKDRDPKDPESKGFRTLVAFTPLEAQAQQG